MKPLKNIFVYFSKIVLTIIIVIICLSFRYEYRVEMIHHASPDSSKNIVREFGEFHEI